MHSSEIAKIAEQAKAKANYLDRVPGGYLVLSALAGVYLGFGVTLIFSIGAPLFAEGAAAHKLVMGVAFGIALTLVIFAGRNCLRVITWSA
jgi:nitrite transporter